MKVAYNNRHGGFSLSDKGMYRYAELSGISLYPETKDFGFVTYWTKPKSELPPEVDQRVWSEMSMDERKASNQAISENTLGCRDFDRTDEILIRVIEELGEAASGAHASLAIAEVPVGERYRIDEYDGAESVMTVDDYEWEIAK